MIVSPSSSKPSASRMRRISASDTSVPSRPLTFSGSSFTVFGTMGSGSTSMVPRITSPQPSSSTSSHARSTAATVFIGSSPFSKRPEASVRMPSAAAVRRTLVPLKFAPSKTTMAVSPTISELAPPMTPATATGFCSSQMQSIFGVSLRAVPSSVSMVSPSRAVRTMICLPPMHEKSKACMG